MPIKIVPIEDFSSKRRAKIASTRVDDFKKLAKKKKKKVVKKSVGGKIGKSLIKAGAAEAKRQRVGGPLTRKKIEDMTNAEIIRNKDLSLKVRDAIIKARKASKEKIESHKGAGKLPGAAKKKKKPGRSTDYRDSPVRQAKKYTDSEARQRHNIRDRIEGETGKTMEQILKDADLPKDYFEGVIQKAAAKKKKPGMKRPSKPSKIIPLDSSNIPRKRGGGPGAWGTTSWHRYKKKAGGGKVGMSHQGLYPAEEARAGTMSEMERAKHMKKGGQVKKKEQGYKDRKDESISMRVKKKRTKKQLKASRDESYGKFGSKAKKRGKINRSSSKGWDGNTEVSRHYDS